GPARAARATPVPAYTEALAAAFGGYMPGAAALQTALLQRPRAASAGIRLLTAPGVRRLLAGTWSLYWNGLVGGARPRPAAWSAALGHGTAGRAPGGRPRGGRGRGGAPPPRAPRRSRPAGSRGRPALITSPGSCAASPRSGT